MLIRRFLHHRVLPKPAGPLHLLPCRNLILNARLLKSDLVLWDPRGCVSGRRSQPPKSRQTMKIEPVWTICVTDAHQHLLVRLIAALHRRDDGLRRLDGQTSRGDSTSSVIPTTDTTLLRPPTILSTTP
jgi:hypothetical protein